MKTVYHWNTKDAPPFHLVMNDESHNDFPWIIKVFMIFVDNKLFAIHVIHISTYYWRHN